MDSQQPPPSIALGDGDGDDKDVKNLLDRLTVAEEKSAEPSSGGGWGGWFSSVVAPMMAATDELLGETTRGLKDGVMSASGVLEKLSEKALATVNDLERWAGIEASQESREGQAFDSYYLSHGGKDLTKNLKALSQKCEHTVESMELSALKFDIAKKITTATRGEDSAKSKNDDGDEEPTVALPAGCNLDTQPLVEASKEAMQSLVKEHSALLAQLKEVAADELLDASAKDSKIADLSVKSKHRMQDIFLAGLFELMKRGIVLIEKEVDELVCSNINLSVAIDNEQGSTAPDENVTIPDEPKDAILVLTALRHLLRARLAHFGKSAAAMVANLHQVAHPFATDKSLIEAIQTITGVTQTEMSIDVATSHEIVDQIYGLIDWVVITWLLYK